MSETLSSIEFNNTVTPAEALRTVADEGAVAIHNFITPYHLQRAARVLSLADWENDNNPNNERVDRDHDLVKYGFEASQYWPVATADKGFAPEPVYQIARKISDFVAKAPDTRWNANEIMGIRYKPEGFIEKHRDYAWALGYVAVLTVSGSQGFYFERDTGDEARVDMLPGTLTIMRGFQEGADKPRPYHWVEPATEERLAVSLREVTRPWDR